MRKVTKASRKKRTYQSCVSISAEILGPIQAPTACERSPSRRIPFLVRANQANQIVEQVRVLSSRYSMRTTAGSVPVIYKQGVVNVR